MGGNQPVVDGAPAHAMTGVYGGYAHHDDPGPRGTTAPPTRATPRIFTTRQVSSRTIQPMRGGWVYIMSNRPDGTLYIGVTADLTRRVREHKDGVSSMFVRRYGLHRLVWFERHEDIVAAISRETRLKNWPRAWKVRLIHHDNPDWDDLYPALIR